VEQQCRLLLQRGWWLLQSVVDRGVLALLWARMRDQSRCAHISSTCMPSRVGVPGLEQGKALCAQRVTLIMGATKSHT